MVHILNRIDSIYCLQVLLSLVGIAGDVIVDRGHGFELEANLPFLVQSDEVGEGFAFIY